MEGERGLLSSSIKPAEEILKLLQAVYLPTKVDIKGHQLGATDIEEGNRLADAGAKGVAERASESQILALVLGPENQALTKL